MSKKIFLYSVLIIALFLSGCGTPLAVKTLSEEELKTIASYQETQKKYFDVIESYVQSHINSAELLMKAETFKQINLFKKKAELQLKKSDADISAILDELISALQTVLEGDQTQIKQLMALLSELKQKHREMRDAYAVILAAQTKLNEYIQLEKADELFVNQILFSVGLQKEKITSIFDNIGSIMKDIDKLSKGGGQK